MSLTDHPTVIAARTSMEAAQEAAKSAERAYFLAAIAAASELGLTREEMLSALGYQRRSGFRALAEHGLTNGAR